MDIGDIKTIDDYIRAVYPEPKDGHTDFNFFKAWGYEQWLIMRYKHDLEQLRILHAPDFTTFQLQSMICDKGADAFIGCKLIRAKKILRRFLMQSVAKGFPGILLKEENDNHFCLFPSYGSVFCQLVGWFKDDEIEILDDTFTTEQALLDMIDRCHVSSPIYFEGHVCHLPDLGDIYVAKTWNNDCYHGSFSIDYALTWYDEKKKCWMYRKGKKYLIRSNCLDYSNVENGTILQ